MGATAIGTIAYFPNDATFVRYKAFMQQLPKDMTRVCAATQATDEQMLETSAMNTFTCYCRNNVAAAWNMIILLAKQLTGSIKLEDKADKLIIMNTDLIIAPDMIQRCSEFLDQHPDVFVTGPRLCSDPQLRHKIANNNVWYCAFMLNLLLLETFKEKDPYRNSVFQKFVGGFNSESYDPAYYEDCDFSRRVMLAGMKSQACEDALCYHEGSFTSKSDELERKKIAQYYPVVQNNYKLIWGGDLNFETFKTPYGR